MSLIGLLFALLIVCVVIWAARAITLTMRTAASAAVSFLAQANLSATTDLVFSVTYITT